MPPPEPLPELTAWIAHHTALLDDAATADPGQVAQSAAAYLRVLEAKDHAAVAALEAIRLEIAAGRPYRQRQTTWARRLAQLDQETAAHNQVRAILGDQLTATRRLLAQLQQKQFSAPPPHRTIGAPSIAPTPSTASTRPTSHRKTLAGLGLLLLLSLGLIGILIPAATRAPAARTITTDRGLLAPTTGPATEEADNIQRPTAWAATVAPPAAKPSPTAPPTAASPTVRPSPTAPPTPTPTPATIVNADANLRAGPGVNHPLTGALTAGQPVKIIARNLTGDWYQLAGGAWIYSALLTNAPTVPVAAVIPTAPPPTVTPAPPTPVRAIVVPPTAAPAPPAPPGRSCCKICTTGKACGDTCIARNKTCHVGPGCACNG